MKGYRETRAKILTYIKVLNKNTDKYKKDHHENVTIGMVFVVL